MAGYSRPLAAKCVLEECWEFAKKTEKAWFITKVGRVAQDFGLKKDAVVGLRWPPMPLWTFPEPEVNTDLLGMDRREACNELQKYFNEQRGRFTFSRTGQRRDVKLDWECLLQTLRSDEVCVQQIICQYSQLNF